MTTVVERAAALQGMVSDHQSVAASCVVLQGQSLNDYAVLQKQSSSSGGVLRKQSLTDCVVLQGHRLTDCGVLQWQKSGERL